MLAMAGAALLFSFMALLAKHAAARLPGPEVAFLRFVIGLLASALLVLGGRRLRPRNLVGLALRGLFGGGAVLLYFLALAHLSAGVATLLNYSSPVFAVLFAAVFLREPLSRLALLALLLTSVGVYLVVAGSQRDLGLPGPAASIVKGADLPYLLGGVVSAVLSGAAVTTIRGMRQSEGSLEIFTAFCLVGGLLTGVPTLFSYVPPAGGEWLTLLGVGLSSVVAQLLMTHALRDLSAGLAGLLLQLTPVATLVGGGLLLHERQSGLALGGAALTLLGVSVGFLRPR